MALVGTTPLVDLTEVARALSEDLVGRTENPHLSGMLGDIAGLLSTSLVGHVPVTYAKGS
jgi:hypothetical protein